VSSSSCNLGQTAERKQPAVAAAHHRPSRSAAGNCPKRYPPSPVWQTSPLSPSAPRVTVRATHSSATKRAVPCFRKAATPFLLPHTVHYNHREPAPLANLAHRAPSPRVGSCTRVASAPTTMFRAAWAARTAPRPRQPPPERMYMSSKEVVRKNPHHARARATIHTCTHVRLPDSTAPSRGVPVSGTFSQQQDIATRPAPLPPAPRRAVTARLSARHATARVQIARAATDQRPNGSIECSPGAAG